MHSILPHSPSPSHPSLFPFPSSPPKLGSPKWSPNHPANTSRHRLQTAAGSKVARGRSTGDAPTFVWQDRPSEAEDKGGQQQGGHLHAFLCSCERYPLPSPSLGIALGKHPATVWPARAGTGCNANPSGAATCHANPSGAATRSAAAPGLTGTVLVLSSPGGIIPSTRVEGTK